MLSSYPEESSALLLTSNDMSTFADLAFDLYAGISALFNSVEPLFTQLEQILQHSDKKSVTETFITARLHGRFY